MRRPSSTASLTQRSAATTRLTSPKRLGLGAVTISPSSNISMASLRDTLRLSATIGVEQNSPILTPGVANRASRLATARSQLATSWQPAAVAIPFTAAMTGFGERTIVSIMLRAGRHGLGEERAAPVFIVTVRRQLLEVVARGERAANAGDDDGADRIAARRSLRSPRSAPRSAPPTGCCAPRGRLSVRTQQDRVPRAAGQSACGLGRIGWTMSSPSPDSPSDDSAQSYTRQSNGATKAAVACGNWIPHC